ncbi:MAG TPA: serine--tRNA ligase [Phycisphaerales bacterium]|nr:serine--tRNA ligase [Phycisphaerales bacterium]
MIDLRLLRENPGAFREGARKKRIQVDIDRLLALDARRRELAVQIEQMRADQNRLAKETGPEIGRLSALLKQAEGAERDRLVEQLEELKDRPAMLKTEIAGLEEEIRDIEPCLRDLLLQVPLPPDEDVPVGTSSDDNVELRRWSPAGFDPERSFQENRGFAPRPHLDLVRQHRLADFERGVKLAGSRSYLLTGDGARLHNAVLRYALDFIVQRGFTPVTVPVLVREEAMIGTGFFPGGREQAYHIDETTRQSPDEESAAAPRAGSISDGRPAPGPAAASPKAHGGDGRATDRSRDLYLTGTGEVSLMGMRMDEILDEAELPLKLCTVSTCFRREAGAAGKDTAGLYRIHQFDKVEQVVICRADVAESRRWHKEMIGIVEDFLKSLEIPHRLLQCCTGDLGPKNADMIDIESWMPGRNSYGETHSASRLYDYQCRRLNMRYRPGGEKGKGATTFCHSLNNTVAASPRILIPILELYQNADGSVTVPAVLRPYMNGMERIG